MLTDNISFDWSRLYDTFSVWSRVFAAAA